jgi:hypothetical protein
MKYFLLLTLALTSFTAAAESMTCVGLRTTTRLRIERPAFNKTYVMVSVWNRLYDHARYPDYFEHGLSSSSVKALLQSRNNLIIAKSTGPALGEELELDLNLGRIKLKKRQIEESVICGFDR